MFDDLGEAELAGLRPFDTITHATLDNKDETLCGMGFERHFVELFGGREAPVTCDECQDQLCEL